MQALIGLDMCTIRNLIIGIIALLIPMAAEFYSPETGLGFDVLLYWPFDFAYVLLIGLVFLSANLLLRKSNSALMALATGGVFWFVWFAVTFLAVGQLHLSLGYKL